jgi:hypothetical protein
MRSPVEGTLIRTLKNQITVKGSFKHSLGGTYYDLYVLAPNGEILGNHQIAVRLRDREGDSNERLVKEISRLTHALKLFRLEHYQHLPTQQQATQYVLRVLFPRAREATT